MQTIVKNIEYSVLLGTIAIGLVAINHALLGNAASSVEYMGMSLAIALLGVMVAMIHSTYHMLAEFRAYIARKKQVQSI